MIKITNIQRYIGLTSLKKFECSNCGATVCFRITSQITCFKCGHPLLDTKKLSDDLETRISYHRDDKTC